MHAARREVEEDRDPVVALDYAYITKDGREVDASGQEAATHDILTMLVVREDRFKSYAATAVQRKGAVDNVVAYVVGFVRSLGYRRLILQSDNEPAILALKREVRRQLDIEVVERESPPYDHQGNGFVEVGCREIKRQCRALVLAMESRLGAVPLTHPTMMWLPRHAAAVLNRYRRGDDGHTPEQRRTGRAWRRPALQFGERVQFKPATAKRADLAPRLEEGLYVGHHERSGSVICLTAAGAYFGFAVKRLEEAVRWQKAGLMDMKGLPWEMKPPTEEQRAPRRPAGPREPSQAEVPPPPAAPGVRARYVTRADVEQHGGTDYCPGCISVTLYGTAKVSHSKACRERMGKLLAQEVSGRGRARLEEHARKRGAQAEGAAAPQAEEEAEAKRLRAADGSNIPEAAEQLEDAPSQGGERRTEALPWLERVRSGKRGAEGDVQASQRARLADKTGQKRAHEVDSEILARPRLADKTGQKRGAEVETQVLEDDTRETSGHADADVVLVAPVGQTADPAAATGAEPADSAMEAASASMLARVRSAFVSAGDAALNEDLAEIALLVAELNGVDVSEIYSPARFCAEAALLGLRPGFSADLEEIAPDGRPWDLSRPEGEQAVHHLLEVEKPKLLCGSPPCEKFSTLQHIGAARRDPAKFKLELEAAKRHLRVAVRAYRRQLDEGRLFLHEHPWSAASWKEPEMAALAADPRCIVVRGAMCAWGMMAHDDEGQPGFVRKHTGWLTNSRCIAAALSEDCPGDHRHVRLIGGGRAHRARIYPPKLVKAILRGLAEELRAEAACAFTDICATVGGEVCAEPPAPGGALLDGGYWDDVNGGWLPPHLVIAARGEELGWVHERKVYEEVDEEQCWQETNRPPISLRWVDTNKGTEDQPRIRSRIVVRELACKTQWMEAAELFSAMPPLEALKLMMSILVGRGRTTRGGVLKMGLYDISRAHFYGVAKRRVFVALPEEEAKPGKCALLLRTMYGTRDASATWQDDYLEHLEAKGAYKRGSASPAIFRGTGADETAGLVHGDDFAVLSDDEGLDAMEALLGERYDFKRLGRLGPDSRDDRECIFLNRVLRYTGTAEEPAMEMEADPKHGRAIVETLGLQDAKAVPTPSVKLTAEEAAEQASAPAMAPADCTKFRSVVMRAAYMAQDRPDLAEAVKTLSRRMVSPTAGDMMRLKRLGRYVLGRPRASLEFLPQRLPQELLVEVDSDFAGDLATRRSTTGVACLLGEHVIKTQSVLQSTVSLSSGESEFYAAVQGSATGLGIQSLLADWNVSVSVTVASDSSAARGLASKRGLSKTRHIATRFLWLQERVRRKEVKLLKVATAVNRGDLFTKSLAGPRLDALVTRLALRYHDGASDVLRAGLRKARVRTGG